MRLVPLSELCAFRHGGTPSKAVAAFWSGDIPWVSPKDMKASTVCDASDRITEAAVANSATSVVPPGSTLLVVRSGILAHTFPVALVTGAVAFNQDIKAVVPKSVEVSADYVYWFLRSKASDVVARGVKKGATVHSVQSGFIEGLQVPLVERDVQQRIVDLLSRAESIVRLRRQAKQKASELIPALYLNMFGDPATNSRQLPTAPLDSLCTLVRGSSPRPQGDPRFFGGSVPRLMIADITRDGTYITPQIDSLTEEGASKSRPMKRGEVVMAVSGAVGLPAILAVDACIHDGFVGFRALSHDIKPEFFYNYLLAFRHFSRTQAVGATFQNLKTEQVRAWQVPRPPAEAQQRFAEMAESARSIEAQQTAALAKADDIFQALLAQAFSVERDAPDSVVVDQGQAALA